MGQQHDFYLVQSGNLVPRAALWRGFLVCFQQPSLLRPANLDSSDLECTQFWASYIVSRQGGFSPEQSAGAVVEMATSVYTVIEQEGGGRGCVRYWGFPRRRAVRRSGAIGGGRAVWREGELLSV